MKSMNDIIAIKNQAEITNNFNNLLYIISITKRIENYILNIVLNSESATHDNLIIGTMDKFTSDIQFKAALQNINDAELLLERFDKELKEVKSLTDFTNLLNDSRFENLCSMTDTPDSDDEYMRVVNYSSLK